MKKILYTFLCLFLFGFCKPLTESKAYDLANNPSIQALANLDYNDLCFDVVNFKDDLNYTLRIIVENGKYMTTTIKNGEVQYIEYDHSKKYLKGLSQSIYQIRQHER